MGTPMAAVVHPSGDCSPDGGNTSIRTNATRAPKRPMTEIRRPDNTAPDTFSWVPL